MVNPFHPVARVAALFLLLAVPACTENAGELMNLLDPEGTIRGHVTLDGTGVPASVLAMGGANRESLLITADASGFYERGVTSGDWQLLGLLPITRGAPAWSQPAGVAASPRTKLTTPSASQRAAPM